jgi:hypothetical protein
MDKIEKLKKFFANSKKKSIKDYQKAICEFGLVNDSSPDLYGQERKFMCEDRGDLAIYQTPVQFAQLLKFLEPIEINSYLEIGVFKGGTFLFMKYFLQNKNPDVELACIDPTDYVHELAKDEVLPHLQKTTSEGSVFDHFDLVFMDGEHNEEWIHKDYINIGQFAKICVVHDIIEPSCPAVIKYWDNLVRETKSGGGKFKNYAQFTETVSDDYIAHHGIGILYND